MNKLLCFEKGQKTVLNDIVFVDAAYRQALYGLLSSFGVTPETSFKLSGCEVTKVGNVFTCTEGYIGLEGEIYHVPAHSLTISNLISYTAAFAPYITYDTSPGGSKLSFIDQVPHDCYQVREAKLAATSLTIGMGMSWNHMKYDAPTLIQVVTDKQNALTTNWQVPPAFAAGWSNSGAPEEDCGFRKDAFGNIYLKGMVISVTPVGTIFTLPIGYRPSFNRRFATYYGSTLIMMMVSSNGEVWPIGVNTHQIIDLSFINFKI